MNSTMNMDSETATPSTPVATMTPRVPRARSVSLGGLGASQTPSSSTKAASRKRKSASLPTETVEYLKNWIMSPEHIAHPYPTEQEKAQIMKDTGIEMKQLTNWFVNNRKRYWKPRVEARLREQQKAGGKKVNSCSSSSKTNAVQLNNMSLGDVVSAVAHSKPNENPILSPSLPPAVVSPGRIISAQSSVVSSSESSSGNLTGSESLEDLFAAGQETEEFVVKSETISVHILRPLGGRTPTMEDVSILSSLPSERILRSFENCQLSFKCNVAEVKDARKVQSRRDAEIVRIKKQYLKRYLSEMEEDVALPSPPPRKRRRVVVVDDTQPYPRPMFRRKSFELWKEACETANSIYDNSLPSLEEASTLFGYKTTTV